MKLTSPGWLRVATLLGGALAARGLAQIPSGSGVSVQPVSQSVELGQTVTIEVDVTIPGLDFSDGAQVDAKFVGGDGSGGFVESDNYDPAVPGDLPRYNTPRFSVVVKQITPGTFAAIMTITKYQQSDAAAYYCSFHVNKRLFIADGGNDSVRISTSTGTVATPALNNTGTNAVGLATGRHPESGNAILNDPRGIAVDSQGNLFVADRANAVIRKITPANLVSTFAGTVGSIGSLDGTGAAARFFAPYGLAVDASDNLYVSDGGANTIRKITPAAVVTTLAGSSTSPGSADGTGAAARFFFPLGLAVDAAGNVFVADADNDTIRKITPAGVVTTFAGKAAIAGSADGTGAAARFNYPCGLAFDNLDNLLVTDGQNNTIRIISPTGVVVTLAGTPGVAGTADGTGAAAQFYYPWGITVDNSGAGNIFITDAGNDTVRMVTQAGVVTTVAGSPGGAGNSDGTGTAARFNNPYEIKIWGLAFTSNSANLSTIPPTAAPAITTPPASQSAAPGGTATFSVSATAGGAYQWLKNGGPLSGQTDSVLVLTNLAASDAGTYSVVITNALGSVTSAGAALTFNAAFSSPSFSVQPTAQTVTSGTTVVFNATAVGSPAPTYQWRLNGNTITGATSARLVITGATSANAGTYTCVATSSTGSATSGSAALTIASTANVGRLVNLSVNTTAGKSQVLTVGFVSGGTGTTGSENLLIRATGPALSALGVPGTLADPTLSVFNTSSVAVAANDNWGTPASNQTAVTAADTATFAFPLPNSASLDAAVAQVFPGGAYTAQISGNTAASGTALAEVYDNTPTASYTLATPRLINISAKNQMAANGSMTAGFVVGGTTSKTVLIRATGPALTLLGVPGAVADPQIALHTTINGQDSVLATDAGWDGDPQITAASNSVFAFPLTNPASKDSVVLVTLPPGSYTAIASSASGAAGTVLIEIYEVP